MDYDLARIDYTICGITYPDTLKILTSPDTKDLQKFAVGDKSGVLQCLSIKDEEPVVQFKTLPGKPITSVQVALPAGDSAHKIFAASGNEVKGYTRRGKVFLSVETSVSETITSMCVLGSDLILCSGQTVTFYRDLSEIYSYTCEDRVLDIVAFATPNTSRVRLLVVSASKSAILLENNQQHSRIYVPSGPTRIIAPLTLRNTEICALYGAADGSIGLIFIEGSELKSKCLVEGRGLGSVMCIGWFHNSAGAHLAVGRHDGSIQLYLIDTENFHDTPRLKYTYFCGEPVTSVCGGCISSEEPELLASTFSGRIFALRSRRRVSMTSSLNNAPQEALALRRSKLESEISRLEKQTANERVKYQRNTRSLNTGLSTPPLLDLQYELTGATHDGWQEVKIISAVPLDVLFIYCDNKLEMHTDSAAVLSICPSQCKAADLLATIRCQAGTRRLWLRMSVKTFDETRVEGSRVSVYVLPAGVPRVARLIKLHLPILAYYSKHEIPEENKKRSWSELRVTGGFSVAEVTSWLTEVMPKELPRPTANVTFARSHTLLGTTIVCRYQRGEAVFTTNDISSISIIKDVISNNSVKRGIRVDINFDIPGDCCLHSFLTIKEQFRSEHKRKKEIDLKNALTCLDVDTLADGDQSEPILCNTYMEAWKSINDDKETNFTDLVDIVVKWYLDWCKLTLNGSYNKNNKLLLQKALIDLKMEDIEDILINNDKLS